MTHTTAGRLAGKVAIITGAGSGLGHATAERFVREGARVHLVDRDAEISQVASALGDTATGHVADVTSAADMEALADRVIRAESRVDIVFANAGIEGVGSADNLDQDDWRKVIDIDLMGVWLSSKFFIPHMVERGAGSIVHTASTGALVGVPGIMPYAAAKGGVVAMTRQMAIDYAARGVRVNAICPGMVPTELVFRNWAQKGDDPAVQLANVASRYPLGRAGTPEDVANAALFLASDEAGWITGQSLVVDGGLTAQ